MGLVRSGGERLERGLHRLKVRSSKPSRPNRRAKNSGLRANCLCNPVRDLHFEGWICLGVLSGIMRTFSDEKALLERSQETRRQSQCFRVVLQFRFVPFVA